MQGFTHCNVFVGLTYNDELVQCMGFNEKGWHDGNTELTRMATKINTQVIGGFSKLMKFVTEVYGYKNITSYINRAWWYDYDEREELGIEEFGDETVTRAYQIYYEYSYRTKQSRPVFACNGYSYGVGIRPVVFVKAKQN